MAVRTLRQKSRFWTAVAAAALIALVVTAAVLVCLAPSVALAASGTADGDVVCIHIPISDEELLAGARPAPVSAEASPIFGDSFLLMSGCYYTATTVVEDDCTVSYELDYAGLKFYVYRSALADAAWVLDPATADIPSDPSPALVLTPDGDSGVWNDADSWTLGDPADYTFEFIGYSDTVRTRVICSASSWTGCGPGPSRKRKRPPRCSSSPPASRRKPRTKSPRSVERRKRGRLPVSSLEK